MMKSMLMMCTLISLTASELNPLLPDIFAFPPLNRIGKIQAKHYESDADYRSAHKFLQSERFRKKLAALNENKGMIRLNKTLNVLGMYIDVDVIPHYLINTSRVVDDVPDNQTASLKGYLEDVGSAIGWREISHQMDYSMHYSYTFRKLMLFVEEHLNTHCNRILESPEFEEVVQSLREIEFDLCEVIRPMYYFYYWTNNSFKSNICLKSVFPV